VNIAEKIVMRPIGALVPYASKERDSLMRAETSLIGLEPERCGSPFLFDRVKKLLRTIAHTSSFVAVVSNGREAPVSAA